MKEVQLIKEELEVLEDVRRDLKAKVVKDLICYELDEPSLDHFFLIDANLRNEREPSSSSFLKLISRSSHEHLTRCPGLIPTLSNMS